MFRSCRSPASCNGGAARASPYIADRDGALCTAGGGVYTASDPDFVAHFDDMAGADTLRYHTQYVYNTSLIADDRRIAYSSTAHPWLVAVFQYQNMYGTDGPPF